MLSDGEHLFCYYDKNAYNGLQYIRRESPYETISLIDEDWDINLKEEKRPKQRGYVIATKSLTNEDWRYLTPGKLTVLKNGEIIYPEMK